MDPEPIFWQIVLQLFLIILNAIFACSEIAVLSLNENRITKLSEKGDKRAKRLLSLTDEPAKFLATIQVGITLAGFLGSAFAADNFSDILIDQFLKMGINLPYVILDTISVILITLLLAYITLVFGELVPKRIAMKKAEQIGLVMSRFVCIVSTMFTPLVWILTKSTNLVLRIFKIDPNSDDDIVTEDDIKYMVEEGIEDGTINQSEKDIIQNVFEFDSKTAEELMTHRTDVVLLWNEDSDEKWEEIILNSNFSMYPICEETTDNVIAILNTKAYFRLSNKERDNVLKNACTSALLIPESLSADKVLQIMKKHKKFYGIVTDEYGGMSGIISLNDLIIEIVGDLEEDIDESIIKIDENTWIVAGNALLDDIAQKLDIEFPELNFYTFQGLVFSGLGGVPDDGTTPDLEEYGLNIKVLEIKNHRLLKAKITKYI